MKVQLHVWCDPVDRKWHVAFPVDGTEHEIWGLDSRDKAIESARTSLEEHYHYSRETAKPAYVEVEI